MASRTGLGRIQGGICEVQGSRRTYQFFRTGNQRIGCEEVFTSGENNQQFDVPSSKISRWVRIRPIFLFFSQTAVLFFSVEILAYFNTLSLQFVREISHVKKKFGYYSTPNFKGPRYRSGILNILVVQWLRTTKII